jgi:hypothetical protein
VPIALISVLPVTRYWPVSCASSSATTTGQPSARSSCDQIVSNACGRGTGCLVRDGPPLVRRRAGGVPAGLVGLLKADLTGSHLYGQDR